MNHSHSSRKCDTFAQPLSADRSMCGRHRDEVVPNFAVVESPPNNKDLEDSIKLMSVELGARSHQQLRSYHRPTDVAIITGICIDTRPSDQHLCFVLLCKQYMGGIGRCFKRGNLSSVGNRPLLCLYCKRRVAVRRM